jgi:hypothetical protein
MAAQDEAEGLGDCEGMAVFVGICVHRRTGDQHAKQYVRRYSAAMILVKLQSGKMSLAQRSRKRTKKETSHSTSHKLQCLTLSERD